MTTTTSTTQTTPTPRDIWARGPNRRGRGVAGTVAARQVVVMAVAVAVVVGAAWCPTARGAQVPACQSVGGQRPVCDCQPTDRGTAIGCASRNPVLVSIPSGLPAETSVLNVASNAITSVLKGDFSKLENLRTIFLQDNELVAIQEGAFDNLYNLQLLVLSNNMLKSVLDNWFQHLSSIQNIDLSNNQISRISRRAFLTLPASKSPSGVTVQLSGNSLRCDCEARAIRDWSQSLLAKESTTTLAMVQLNGFRCVNANGRELNSLSDQDFDCSTTPVIFSPGQKCRTCRNEETQHACDETRVALCGSAEPVCLSQVVVSSGKLSLYKACSTYTDCLLRARNNHVLCNVSHADPAAVDTVTRDCIYCCTGSSCSQADMGGRTKSYVLYVGLLLSRDFQQYMLDSKDARYIQLSNIYSQKVNEIFRGVSGGFDSSFLSFRNESGETYVTCLVHVSALNTYALSTVGGKMAEALNDSARQENGFLYQQGTRHVFVGTSLIKRCLQGVTRTPQGDITWPETSSGAITFAACPSSTPQSGTNRFATRACVLVGGGAVWRDPDLSACQKSDVTDSLVELNSTAVTPDNVDTVLTQLEQLTSSGGDTLTPTDVTLAVDTAERAVAQGEALQSAETMDSLLQVLSNVLDAQEQTLVLSDRANQSAGRMLSMADKIGAEGKLGSGGQLLLTSPNMAVGALAVDPASFKGATLTANTARDLDFQPGDVQIQPLSARPSPDVTSLMLPPTVLRDTSASRIAMRALVSDKLFKVIQQSKAGAVSDARADVRQVNSHVLDATVVGRDVRNLPDPVTMTFVHLSENASSPACVFWDTARLHWSSEGCSLDADLSTATSSTCRCSHLTNFALLMDVYGEGGALGETDRRILSIISYIGCGVSLLALLLTLLTYVLFNPMSSRRETHESASDYGHHRKLRRDNPSKILVNLCVALALSNLVFVAGMQPYALDSLVGCKVVAVLLHFSLLSALCWMAVEAFYMYLALVLVFKTYFTNFLLKCSLIGWGVPLVTVAITLGVNKTDNYGPLDSGVCWIKGLAFYVAFVGPVGLILLVNFLAFGLVLKQILGLAERKLNKSDSFSAAQQLRGAVGVAILLGLTWVFALFAVDRASVVFYYLFAVFNSLQGLWIFVFYCLLKKEARNAWRRALPCCRSLDDKSVLSNTRGAYSGTAMKTERSKSSTDNGLTTTTAFTSSSVDSDGAYSNLQTDGKADSSLETDGKADQRKTPSNTGAVQSSEVHIRLREPGDPNQTQAGGVQPTSDHPPRTVHRSEGNVPLPAVSKGTHPPQQITIQQITIQQGFTTSGTKPWTRGGETKGPGADPDGGPRPLHFRVGYTLSNTSTTSTSQSEAEPSSDTPPSVAEMIKNINTKL